MSDFYNHLEDNNVDSVLTAWGDRCLNETECFQELLSRVASSMVF